MKTHEHLEEIRELLNLFVEAVEQTTTEEIDEIDGKMKVIHIPEEYYNNWLDVFKYEIWRMNIKKKKYYLN